MSLDRVKTTVLEEANARAGKKITEAKQEADRLLAEGRTADERANTEAIRDARLRLERETVRELERIGHDNRLQVLSAKNIAIDEVFKHVKGKVTSSSGNDRIAMIGKWLQTLPSDVGGVLRVNPHDVVEFTEGLEKLNSNRSGNGLFTSVVGDSKISSGAVVDGPDYNIDCTIERRLNELRETSAGDLARVLFGA